MADWLTRAAALSIAGIVVAAGTGTAYAELSAAGPAYRLARVSSADVTAALHVTGTLTPVRQADVSFPVSGTVATVAVTAGQHVAAGQRLGALDTAPLQGGLTSAQSALASASLRVHNDLASQDTAATTAASAPAGSPASSPWSLQKAVLAAQHTADTALARAKAALSQATQACAAAPAPGRTAVLPGPAAGATAPASPAVPAGTANPPPAGSARPTPTAAPTTTAGPAPPTIPPPAAPTTTASPSPSPSACVRATQRVLAAETAVLHAQQALSRQLGALGAALTLADGSGGGSGGRVGGSAQPVSAAQLAADQAAADAAAAQVTVAQQDLADASVVSPISGTVVSADVVPGAAAGAGSTAFEVAGLSTFEVVTTVPVTDLPQLRVGQQASVQPDGLSARLRGSVVSIGLMPDPSSSPATYSVTIALAGQPARLHAGALAGVAITTGHGHGVSVPTSAVHESGRSATVIVLAGGTARVTRVTVGTKGPVLTQITAGLRPGQQVVLADLGRPLPTASLPGPGGGPGRIVRIGAGRFGGG